ncbi:hypothetical protein WICPIJ_007166 [Wickerhamomyces pijperi]|uniref:Uncharacterized protein n=1 Tax=Wickerhamomyces pijperi TaxID=599730 RepID=A0A9P8TKB6_WICPI|nr:hypothetical protein WICPIJ_007166 [Wickerhamomyces pijperi]
MTISSSSSFAAAAAAAAAATDPLSIASTGFSTISKSLSISSVMEEEEAAEELAEFDSSDPTSLQRSGTSLSPS